MNTGIPIFKNHKIQHFVTICEKSLFEISSLNEQNHFITKAYAWRNRFMKIWTLFLRYNGHYGSKCQNLPHHPMQILVNFENGGTCIHRSLKDAIYWIVLNRLVVWLTDIFAYLGVQK